MARASALLSIGLLLLISVTAAAQDETTQKKQAAATKSAKSQRKQKQYPPKIDGAEVEVYKTIGNVKLSAWIFAPKTEGEKNRRPAVVFFFGGGWRGGSPTQFVPHCQHLAERGMVAMVVDYRVASRHQVKMTACVSDAKSAIRWVRENADRLGIDPDRIAAGGGSAGGHLAAATALLADFDDPSDDMNVSCKPNAMILFNPALVLAPVDGEDFFDKAKVERFKQASGGDPKKSSPYHGITSNLPPAIIFHGMADKTVPFATAELFTRKMKEQGNRCELVGYEGRGHGFFNLGKKHNPYFHKTVAEMDKFLVSLGFLDAAEAKTESPTKSREK